MQDLELLLARLIRHNVHFVIVGGFAAVAHGVTLITQDMDVCCDFAADNLLRLQEAVKDLNPIHRMTPQRMPLELTAENCKGLKNIYLSTDWGQLDCIGEVQGVGDYEEVIRQSEEIELDIGMCRILKIQALIASKKAMNRPRDREAVLQLTAIQEKTSTSEF